MSRALPLSASEHQDIELAIVDIGVARAFWEGVPAARLLARIRLDRDERDLVDLGERATGMDLASSTWDKLAARLLAGDLEAHERVKRAVSGHGRAASDEGPLPAEDATIAALVHALLSATESDNDASPAEGAADGAAVSEAVMHACGALDDRLARLSADRRAAAFEACLQLATLAVSPFPTTVALLRELGEQALSPAPLYPWGEQDVPDSDRHALLLDRTVVMASPRFARELASLAPHHGFLVAFAKQAPRSVHDRPSVPASSWMPTDLGSRDAATRLAAALERGATTAPRVRSVVLRGGDAALDAIGAEMLDVSAHPFASAVFADILGRASRERDVVRLVSYFAIAPDVATAAHALAASSAPEVPTVLRAWLQSLAPDSSEADGPAASRFASCIAALAPYPHLHAAMKRRE